MNGENGRLTAPGQLVYIPRGQCLGEIMSSFSFFSTSNQLKWLFQNDHLVLQSHMMELLNFIFSADEKQTKNEMSMACFLLVKM